MHTLTASARRDLIATLTDTTNGTSRRQAATWVDNPDGPMPPYVRATIRKALGRAVPYGTVHDRLATTVRDTITPLLTSAADTGLIDSDPTDAIDDIVNRATNELASRWHDPSDVPEEHRRAIAALNDEQQPWHPPTDWWQSPRDTPRFRQAQLVNDISNTVYTATADIEHQEGLGRASGNGHHARQHVAAYATTVVHSLLADT